MDWKAQHWKRTVRFAIPSDAIPGLNKPISARKRLVLH